MSLIYGPPQITKSDYHNDDVYMTNFLCLYTENDRMDNWCISTIRANFISFFIKLFILFISQMDLYH